MGGKVSSCCLHFKLGFNRHLAQKTEEAQASCRYDWYQTGGSVVVSIFAKVPIPDRSYVEANPVKLHLHITFGEDHAVYDQTMLLHGVSGTSLCLLNKVAHTNCTECVNGLKTNLA